MTEELKKCPFCNAKLIHFGKDVRDGKAVEIFTHPYKRPVNWNSCPLSGLVFDSKRWNKRAMEKELFLAGFRMAVQCAQYLEGDHDRITSLSSEYEEEQAFKQYRASLRKRVGTLQNKLNDAIKGKENGNISITPIQEKKDQDCTEADVVEEKFGTKFFDGIPCFVPNIMIRGKDNSFYVSFNHVYQQIYGCDTTALVLEQMQHFYILNGNHIEEYKKLIPLGFDACLEYFKAHQDQKNKYSESAE